MNSNLQQGVLEPWGIVGNPSCTVPRATKGVLERWGLRNSCITVSCNRVVSWNGEVYRELLNGSVPQRVSWNCGICVGRLHGKTVQLGSRDGAVVCFK